MTSIAILGAGQVGRALGLAWRAKGHSVAFGVRNPSDTKHAGLGPGVASNGEAAARAEVVVLATPWSAAQAAIAAAGELSGKVVLDCTNPIAFTQAEGLQLALGFETSGGEQVAGWARGAKVFKTLNQTGAENMASARAFAPPPVMFVAGDDASAKPLVMGLVTDLGFEALDAGPLRNARLLEPFALLWIDQARVRGQGRDFAFAITRRVAGADA
jgi:8-hydroxy-5-deazaflavin:NADPH oxidoreductase